MVAVVESNRAPAPPLKPVVVFGVLAFALALRVLHLTSSLQSPLSYQPGPDEDYYLRFGEAVAAGRGADSAEFTFMDPGYGYLLGAVFKLTGTNPVLIYLLQVLLDTATVFGLLVIGRKLGRPRAGVYGALLYALTATAIMFCTALLKEICVAAYLTWWVAGALTVLRSGRKAAWAAFGVYCGVGIALRSTLLLLAVPALLLPGLALWPQRADSGTARAWAQRSALVCVGLLLSLAPWSLRNLHAYGSLSPLPHNGGIVLHQAYNEQNPDSSIWIPAFVNYSHPSEIWRGYEAEANRRAGRSLSPPEVDDYWRGQALGFMLEHPAQVAASMLRKGAKFLADTEIPNNRSSAEERLFSPVLRVLPQPMVWLLALGLVGLAWLSVTDRRWLVIAAPVAIAWLTVAIFWAEDRFRFHAAPMLALSGGMWIDGMLGGVGLGGSRDSRRWALPVFGLAAVAVGVVSLYLGTLFPAPAVRWDHVVWGYVKMGKLPEAHDLAARIAVEQPDNAAIFEALGYLAAVGGQYDEAVANYRRATQLRPRSYVAHFNLAKALLALGQRQAAAAEAHIALDLSSAPDVQALLTQIEAAP